MAKEEIPKSVIAIMSKELGALLTHAQIDTAFYSAEAPGDPPDSSKIDKVNQWLRRTNLEHKKPLTVLGGILEEILEADSLYTSAMHSPSEEQISDAKRNILKALQLKGLVYHSGGTVSKSGVLATESLQERVASQGLSAIGIEIDRALNSVSDDPNGAVQFAANVLEAALKHYLVARNISFNEQKDKLTTLWQLVRDDLKMNPKNLTSTDLKKIASGLGSIVDGTMYLRDKKSGAHGRTQQQLSSNKLRPRHARLVIHSAHTLSVYVIECLDDM